MAEWEDREKEFREFIRRQSATVRDLVRFTEALLTIAEVSSVNSLGTRHREAIYLTFRALGLASYSRDLLDARVTPAEAERVFDLTHRRIETRTPTPYLTNEALYLGYRFYIDERAIIPRSAIAPFLREVVGQVEWKNKRILDLCAGSGALGISVALIEPSVTVDLADVSSEALAVAQMNIERFRLGSRARCIQSDLFSYIDGEYSLILSNPPYIPDREFNVIASEEIRREPEIAFTGGPDGMDNVIPILEKSQDHLTESGTLLMEVGLIGSQKLRERYPKTPFKWWTRPGKPWSGVFTLRKPYPLG